MKVQNMTSRNGNKIANQFIITDGLKATFQSYESEIITLDYENMRMFVGNNWDYSTTTGKYRNMFLADYVNYTGTKKDFEKCLNNGVLVDNYFRTWEIVKEWETPAHIDFRLPY